MKKTFCIFLLCASVQIGPVFAFDIFSKKLKYYTCTSESNAMSCQNCKLDQTDKKLTVFLNFKIDKLKGSVIYQWYEGSALVRSNPKEKCIVIDSSNWVCDDIYDVSNSHTSRYSSGMNNGVFYRISERQSDGIPGTKIGPSKWEFYECAR